jgi:hypothetical protein
MLSEWQRVLLLMKKRESEAKTRKNVVALSSHKKLFLLPHLSRPSSDLSPPVLAMFQRHGCLFADVGG